MMTSALVVETSVNVTSNSPCQDYTHPDDHNLPNYDMSPGFKPFTIIRVLGEFLSVNGLMPEKSIIYFNKIDFEKCFMVNRTKQPEG